MLTAYATSPTVGLRNKIAQANMGLVRKVAHRYVLKSRTPYEDLEQVGMIGLIKAIERFDPSQQAALSSFAVPYIRGEILHYLRDREDIVKPPRQDKEEFCQVDRTVREMARLGQVVTHLQAAAACGLNPERWAEVLASTRRLPMVELEESHASYEVELPEASAVACLTFNQRQRLKMYYEQKMTTEEIAMVVGVTAAEVRQTLNSCVQKLANAYGLEIPSELQRLDAWDFIDKLEQMEPEQIESVYGAA